MRSRDPDHSLRSGPHDVGPHGDGDRQGRPEVVIAIGAGAISGFVVGLLFHWGVLAAGAVFLLMIVAGWVGWCARGVAQ